jgi:hypothetical protein
MLVRIAGLAYQKGFGGHFHNDDAIAVLRDIPGIAVIARLAATTRSELYRTALAPRSAGDGWSCDRTDCASITRATCRMATAAGWQLRRRRRPSRNAARLPPLMPVIS